MPLLVEAYVARLHGRVPRLAVGLTATLLTLLGALLYPAFNRSLVVSVEPTPDSPSGIARSVYKQYFPPDPVRLIVLTKAVDGSPIVDLSARLELNTSRPLRKWLSYNASTPLTGRAAAVSHELCALTAGVLDLKCRYTFASYFDVGLTRSHAGTHDRPAHDLLDDLLQAVARPQLFDRRGDMTLALLQVEECHGARIDAFCVGKDPNCQPILDVMDAVHDYIGAQPAGSSLELELVSFPTVFKTIQQGVDAAMLISTLSVVPAFILLGVMLRNLRLLLVTLLNIAVSIASSIAVMYPIAASTKVSSEAPALMVASGLALSIDYSLFLLTRFGEEVRAGATVEQALVVTLQTSGHTVLVSGFTLCLCFLGMLLIPVSTISTMGVAAASTVVFAILCALTVTPSLLLTMPDFFTASRRLGLTCDGVAAPHVLLHRLTRGTRGKMRVGGGREPMLDAQPAAMRRAPVPVAAEPDALEEPAVQPLHAAPSPLAEPTANGTPPDVLALGFWARLGRLVQRAWWLFLPLLVAAAAPFVMPLLRLGYIEGVLSLLPRGDMLTDSFIELQATFGVTTVFPNTVVILPPAPLDLSQRAWLNASCHALREVGRNVTEVMRAHGRATGDAVLANYTMDASDFSGVMIQGGLCTGLLVELLESPLAKEWGDMLIGAFANAERTATKVKVTTTLDPFSTVGQKWIDALRVALDASQRWVPDPSFPHEAVVVGEIHLTGMAEEQMDGAAATFASLPRVIGATLVIVMCVLGLAFRSLLVPVRAVLCLVWMLIVTFGVAVLVYQTGVLEAWGLRPFSVSPAPPAPHALFWMSPCIAFSILVGLGLDYDIFFMEAVVEHYDHGFSPRDAVVLALRHTGTTICVAGVIMFLAFGALLLGSTPILNQIGFLLCLGVLIDCFVTTKVIIPCAMAMLDLIPGDANFWPRERPVSGHAIDPSNVNSRRTTLMPSVAQRHSIGPANHFDGAGSTPYTDANRT